MLKRWLFRLLLRWSWFLSARESMNYEAYRWMILDGYNREIWKALWNNGWTYHFTEHQWLAVFMWYERSDGPTYVGTMDLLLERRWRFKQ